MPPTDPAAREGAPATLTVEGIVVVAELIFELALLLEFVGTLEVYALGALEVYGLDGLDVAFEVCILDTMLSLPLPLPLVLVLVTAITDI